MERAGSSASIVILPEHRLSDAPVTGTLTTESADTPGGRPGKHARTCESSERARAKSDADCDGTKFFAQNEEIVVISGRAVWKPAGMEVHL